MLASFEAIADERYAAFSKKWSGQILNNTAESLARRGEIPRVVVEARDIDEPDGRKGSPQARNQSGVRGQQDQSRSRSRTLVEARDIDETDGRKGSPQARSQSVVRGQQDQSRSRSRTLSPQRKERPKEMDPMVVAIAQSLKDPGNRKKKANEKPAKLSEQGHKARELSHVLEKAKMREQSKDDSVKTMHRSNLEDRSSPVSENNKYATLRRTSSSLSSTASTRREEAHAAAVLHRQQRQPKSSHAKQQKDLHLKDFERAEDKALMKKQQQSAFHHAGLSSQRTDISLTEAYLRTPASISESSITASPNIIYQALRTGNSSSLSQSLLSPLNLSDSLQESTSNVSVFEDFHNPNVRYDPPLLPTPHSSLSKGLRSSHAEDAGSVTTATSSVLKQRLVVKSESASFDSTEEMSYYRFVSRHSILQLCTEDLMSDNWKLVDYALYRLCEVCCTAAANSEVDEKAAAANRIRFIKAGGHALIVGVMKKYSRVADLQTSACRLIQNFISLDRAGAFNELFASVYGMDRVLAAIHQFPATDVGKDDEVYRYACGALVAIVCSSFKMVQRLMQDPRNLRIFLNAMHSDVNKKAVGVCRVLNFLSKQPDFHTEIVIAGGLEEIAEEMKLNPENKQVQHCGCEALGNVVKSSNSSDMAELIIYQLEGAHLIVAAMKAFPTSEELQEKAAYALFHFSAHHGVLAFIKKAAGLSALGICLENFPNNKTIQENGCAAMKKLLETGSTLE